MVGEHELEQCIPVGITGDRAQIDRRAAVGEVALQHHHDRDGPLFEIVEREAGEKHVGREAIGVDHAPRRVAEMLVHRSEDRIDLGFGLRSDVANVVRIPNVRVSLIGNNVAMRPAICAFPSRRCHR
jgi:hypothetical protein